MMGGTSSPIARLGSTRRGRLPKVVASVVLARARSRRLLRARIQLRFTRFLCATFLTFKVNRIDIYD